MLSFAECCFFQNANIPQQINQSLQISSVIAKSGYRFLGNAHPSLALFSLTHCQLRINYLRMNPVLLWINTYWAFLKRHSFELINIKQPSCCRTLLLSATISISNLQSSSLSPCFFLCAISRIITHFSPLTLLSSNLDSSLQGHIHQVIIFFLLAYIWAIYICINSVLENINAQRQSYLAKDSF